MVKYAEANRAFFAIRKEANQLTMIIRDNGKGFDVAHPKEGNGMNNMKKRATEIAARLMIDSEPGNGTTIQLSVAV
jgi:signal transduction histidine kinase